MSWLAMMCTLRKNKPPAGSIMRCEPVSVFSSRPSLNHCMLGVGLPSAWQLNVNGSFFGTVVSMGCSMMRGFSPGTRERREGFLLLLFHSFSRAYYFFYSSCGLWESNPTLRQPLECVFYFILVKGRRKRILHPAHMWSSRGIFLKRNSSLTAKQVLSLNAAAIKRPLSSLA